MASEDLVFVIELKLMWFARDLDTKPKKYTNSAGGF